MTDSNPTTNRSHHTPTPDTVTFRDAEEVEGDEGMMEIRMPIASTGDVRNQGDEPLSGAELRGMAQQVDTLTRGVFPEHGHSSAVDDGVYSQFEKLGYWADADLRREASSDDSDLLVATARMPDPETLPAATGVYRQALAILKEQAKRGIPVAASIGWRDDEDAPGGVDLMEASIVGIPADPRTNTSGGTELLARAAVESGADPDDFVAEVRRLVERSDAPDDARPFGPPGDPNRWDDFEECVAEVEDWDGVDDPEAYCGWAKSETEQTEDAQSQSMTDDDSGDDTPETTDEQAADDGETREDGDETRDALDPDEFRSEMLEMQRQQTETLSTLVDAMREDMDDEEEDDDEDDEDEEEQGGGYDDDEEEDDEDGRESETDDLKERAEDVREADSEDLHELDARLDDLESELEAVRNGDVDVTAPQTEQDADATEESDEETRDADDSNSGDAFSGLGDHISAR